jgi:hypothetical protein
MRNATRSDQLFWSLRPVATLRPFPAPFRPPVLPSPPFCAASCARVPLRAVRVHEGSAGYSPGRVTSPRSGRSPPERSRQCENRLGDATKILRTQADALRHLPGPVPPRPALREMPSSAKGVSCFAATGCTLCAPCGSCRMPSSPVAQCTGFGDPCTYRNLQTTSIKGRKE